MFFKNEIKVLVTCIRHEIKQTNCLLDALCKKVTRLNNNLAPNNPDAWLGFENQSRAAELREKNPETFEMVSELLKMYLGYDDGANNTCNNR